MILSWNAVFTVESKADLFFFLITPGKDGGREPDMEESKRILLCEWEAILLWQATLLLRLSTHNVLRWICPLVYWEIYVPAGTTGDCSEPLEIRRVVWDGEGKVAGIKKKKTTKSLVHLWPSPARTVALVLKGTTSLQCTALVRAADSRRILQQVADISENSTVLTPWLEKQGDKKF